MYLTYDPPSLPRRAFGVAMPEEQHAHSPYSRAALHCRGAADRRGRTRCRRGRDAGCVAVGPHAYGGRPVCAPSASHGLHCERRGCGRSRRAQPCRPCGAGARVPLPRAQGLPMARAGTRRRRGSAALRGARAYRARGQLHHGRLGSRAAALRAAGREPLLGVHDLCGGRGDSL